MAQPNLDVWMNGEFVGTWFWLRTGTPAFRYDDAWARSPHARPLSLSLPLTSGNMEHRGQVVEAFFDNLLPDNDRIRQRLSLRFRTPTAGTADLLAAMGRDCVGALQLLPTGSAPPDARQLQSEPLSESGVEDILRSVTNTEPADDPAKDLRVSIAGAQEKTALLRIGRRWHRPLGATPTTHIFKLPLGLVGNLRADMTASVANEWLCARILAALGFRVAHTEMARFGSQEVLVVERFDRAWRDGKSWIARLPQEDFCQALGVPWRNKYESDGGPGIPAALALLAGSTEAPADKLHFVMTQLAFWLLAAGDGHAKNFSIFLQRGGSYRATPLYDVLSYWPILGDGPNQVPYRKARLAMALRSTNTHYHLFQLQRRHWQALADRSGVPGAFGLMVRLAESVPLALDQVQAALPAGFPAQVWGTVRNGTLAHAEAFLRPSPT